MATEENAPIVKLSNLDSTGYVTIHYRRVRVRSVGFDTSGDEPKLVYVFQDGRTEDAPAQGYISILWDSGGVSVVENDHNVTFLPENGDAE